METELSDAENLAAFTVLSVYQTVANQRPNPKELT